MLHLACHDAHTQPPKLPAGPVIMGINHFVLKSHPCRADAGLPTEEHTGAPASGGCGSGGSAEGWVWGIPGAGSTAGDGQSS